MSSKSVLLLVDLQNDFMPGGSLGVAGADQVIAVANRLQSKFDTIIVTRDWHPWDHSSFASNHPGRKVGEVISLNGTPQVLWPDHCVQNTPGAELAPGLFTEKITATFLKGTDRFIDSYSAFFDNAHLRSTGLADYLREREVREIFTMGIATDYCVKYTVLDGLELGFKMLVVKDGCRAVNLKPDDGETALRELYDQGAFVVSSVEI